MLWIKHFNNLIRRLVEKQGRSELLIEVHVSLFTPGIEHFVFGSWYTIKQAPNFVVCFVTLFDHFMAYLGGLASCGHSSFVLCSMMTTLYSDCQGSEPSGETGQFLTGSILYYVRIAVTTLLA